MAKKSQTAASWRAKTRALIENGDADVLPAQEAASAGFFAVGLIADEGPGIVVLAKSSGPNVFGRRPNARVDGFTIIGADTGGGIMVNGYTPFLEISNNRIGANEGTYGDGIRVGHAALLDETVASGYTHTQNGNVNIHHNQVNFNGTTIGPGGGMALYTGANSYRVTSNFVCGNFANAGGAGFAHVGHSDKLTPLGAVSSSLGLT